MAGNFIILLFVFLFSIGKMIQDPYYETPVEECITCHGDLLKNNVIHPQLEATCDICHSSTGEDHPKSSVKGFTLSEKLPVICFNCHDDFQVNMDSSRFVHGPVRDSISCVNCHNPHSSDQQRLLIDGTNNLCLRCHNKTIIKDSIRISNINQLLSDAKSVHAPVESGECVTCHNPHFAEQRSLLIGFFPSEQYVNATLENFEICFLCHDSDIIDSQMTEFGTNFRDGNRNLHFVHINGDKGRNCTVCHDMHGAANDRLIIDRLRFGKWEMKIIFDTNENGGTCLTGCHSERKYDRTISK